MWIIKYCFSVLLISNSLFAQRSDKYIDFSDLKLFSKEWIFENIDSNEIIILNSCNPNNQTLEIVSKDYSNFENKIKVEFEIKYIKYSNDSILSITVIEVESRKQKILKIDITKDNNLKDIWMFSYENALIPHHNSKTTNKVIYRLVKMPCN